MTRTYNVFAFYKNDSRCCVRTTVYCETSFAVRQAIHLALFTTNSVLTNNTVVPVYNEFSYYKHHMGS